MRIDKNKASRIFSFRYIQNVEKNDEYFYTGTKYDFIKGLKKENFLKESLFDSKIRSWLFDEFYIFKAPLSEFSNLDELFYYINYISSPNKESWVKQIEDYNLVKEDYSTIKFKETVDWAIIEPLFEPNNIFLELDFKKIKKPIWFLKSYNPLFLGFIYQDHYYYYNYNGYI